MGTLGGQPLQGVRPGAEGRTRRNGEAEGARGWTQGGGRCKRRETKTIRSLFLWSSLFTSGSSVVGRMKFLCDESGFPLGKPRRAKLASANATWMVTGTLGRKLVQHDDSGHPLPPHDLIAPSAVAELEHEIPQRLDTRHRLRIYMPYGELIPGMAYLVRRLLENTSNDSFLRAGFVEQVARDELLRDPLDNQQDPSTKREEEVT